MHYLRNAYFFGRKSHSMIIPLIIYRTRYASVDSGHEDDMDDETNQEEFPDVCLFSVAMMMMEKVIFLDKA